MSKGGLIVEVKQMFEEYAAADKKKLREPSRMFGGKAVAHSYELLNLFEL